MKTRWARPAILAAVSLLLVAGLLIGRVVSESRAELSLANEHRENGQLMRAVEHYRRALRWSSPLSSSNAESIAALESIARESEAARDLSGALLAWRSLAGGLAATRFLYLNKSPARERAEHEIARLLANDPEAGIDANLDSEKLIADHRRLLAEDIAPDPLWGTLLLGGFALWLGSLVAATRRGFDSAGRLRWPEVRRPICGALAGFASFVLGLLFA